MRSAAGHTPESVAHPQPESPKAGRGRPGSLASQAGAIKKLPQVGQEPVEAVESGHIGPDGPSIIDLGIKSKDIPIKIPLIFRASP
jgi:hypothetical protein